MNLFKLFAASALLSGSAFAEIERTEIYYQIAAGTEKSGVASEKYFAKLAWGTAVHDKCLAEVELRAQKLLQRSNTNQKVAGYVSDEDLDIRNATVNCMFDDWELVLGKQQVTWGQSDYFRVLDTINPLDTREHLLAYMDDLEEARLPLTMLNLSRILEDGDFQFLIIPDVKSTLLPINRSEFDNLSISGIENNFNLPNDFTLKNTSLASRLRFFLGEWDVGLYSYYGWDFDPKPEQLNESNEALTLYRKKLFGVSLSRPLGVWVFRSDIAWQPDSQVSSSQGTLEVDRLSMLAGFDYALDTLSFSFQYANFHQLNASKNHAINRRYEQGSVSVSKYFLAERLFIQNDLILEKHRGKLSQLNKLNISYKLRENMGISGGLINYFGSKNSALGQFKNNSRIYFKLDFSF